MGVFGSDNGHPLIGFDDEFKIGDILSVNPEIFGLGIHPFYCGLWIANFRLRN
jgi:hypothetical protein